MGNVCEPLFRKCSGKKYTKKNSTSQQWFDTDCRTKRNKFYDDLKNYKRNKNEVNRIRLSDSRSEYKNMINKKKYDSRRTVTKKLVEARLTNAKQYWKMLKDSSVKVKCKCGQFCKLFQGY